MARICGRPTIKLEVTISLSEDEARALDALLGYDVESFLKTFYKEMGESYLKPYEAGLRSLHNSRGFLADPLNRIDKSRQVFESGRKGDGTSTT